MSSAPSIYSISVPVFSAMLKNLSAILEIGEKNAAERNIDPGVFLTARLAPDMFTLTRQVQIATDHAKNAPFRLAGREAPRFEDNETSFADLQVRIAKVRELLAGFRPEDFDGAENRQIHLKLPRRELEFTAMDYLQRFAMPNFYFHVTTAYAILRHNGVPVGKGTFLGG
ncbi:MAG: DUF1993 domain-containing protein [Nitratireductor sp.]|nr:DUF1993 domain-containing protein [Nitratireductor sp.]